MAVAPIAVVIWRPFFGDITGTARAEKTQGSRLDPPSYPLFNENNIGWRNIKKKIISFTNHLKNI